MEYPVISLFSGAMGLDIGLEKAGLDIRIAQDIDPCCVKTAEANGHQCIHGDIRELIQEDPDCKFLLKPAGLYPGEVFAVVGGPPCQPFSTAGKRLATNDPRGSLFMEFCHVIKVVRPRFFVMENVKGLLSSAIKHRPLKDRDKEPLTEEEKPGSAFNVIKNTLMSLGYKIEYGVLDAVHYGVPQFRERLIIIGSRDHEDIFLPVPTHFHSHQDPNYRWRTLRDAIQDLEDDPGEYIQFSEERLKYLRMVPPGGNWRDLPEDVKPIAMGGAYHSGGGKIGFYRRLDYDQPSPTLVTSPVQKATMFCHPTQDRPLSVKEYARIQQFPDDWQFEGKISDQYRLIGNAVPVGLGYAIGQTLRSVAEGTARIVTRRFRGTSVHESIQRVITVAQN
ncbi:DNA (cytosine-5)-methyltransferase 1 [Planifilum fulgidum]|uniref:DNA (cytosine-5-)-methyltransferase n=1 Tax=Planifilum fulgidum TaxID=201973 RepID=A0A1I2T8G4_9BACL|nr:DNA cytosine methyltransferase [Planifilum fulgidum]SFG61080.1 DNA (cytosine-5)-methyltransferase 1 [Planifilum fulgidum]